MKPGVLQCLVEETGPKKESGYELVIHLKLNLGEPLGFAQDAFSFFPKETYFSPNRSFSICGQISKRAHYCVSEGDPTEN